MKISKKRAIFILSLFVLLYFFRLMFVSNLSSPNTALTHQLITVLQNDSIIISVLLMLVLSLIGTNIVISLIVSALVGGILSGLTLKATLNAFNDGISGGANIALSYALLGAFAVAISRSGLPQALTTIAIKQLTQTSKQVKLKWMLFLVIAVVSISSQNIIPIHIAFIPLLIPPLLYVMSYLTIDRRAITCVMAFGLITPYMFLPVGFGNIFLNTILLGNIEKNGMSTESVNVIQAMAIPALGMFIGLLVAVFITYRRPREYDLGRISAVEGTEVEMDKRSVYIALGAIVIAFVIQLYSGSMILGALAGFLLFVLTNIIKHNEADALFTQGVKMMAAIGFVMITAQGYAEVLKVTGKIGGVVQSSTVLFANSKMMASFVMMLMGLIITMGIGSSFSTVPIIAAVYVPICISMGYSELATVCLIGAAAAIGDAGAPASDTVLASTAGLSVDGQHNHIRDSVIPTFIHFNIPLFIAGWIGSLVL